MNSKRGNNLIVIENGQINTYLLDDKLVWLVGRPSLDNNPDIKLYSSTVSRRHGKFENKDGIWFFVDNNGKNGTIHNNKRVRNGINGKVKPVILNDGDILIFGGGDEPAINCKTIWSMYSTKYYDEQWRVMDTKGLDDIFFIDSNGETQLHKPAKGTVVNKRNGLAVYMGDVTYVIGDIELKN